MANVRISSDWKHLGTMEWAGAPRLDPKGHLERSATIPEEAYRKIEGGIAEGNMEGDIYLRDQTHVHWFLDR